MDINDITSKLISVRYFTRTGISRTQSKRILKEVQQAHGNSDDVVGAWVRNIPKDYTTDITTCISRAGTFVNQHTLKTGDVWRLVPARGYPKLLEGVNEYNDRLQELVRTQLLDNYDDLAQVARAKYAGLWEDADFPAREELERSFEVGLRSRPVAPVNTAIRGLSEDMLEGMRKGFQSEYTEEIQGALTLLVDDVADTMGLVVQKLSANEPRTKYKNLIEKVHKIGDRVDFLNVNDDPELDRAVQEMREWVRTTTPVMLRNSRTQRDRRLEKAKDILERMTAKQEECGDPTVLVAGEDTVPESIEALAPQSDGQPSIASLL